MKVSIDKSKWQILGVIFLLALISLVTFDILRRGIFSGKTGLNVVVVGDKTVGLLLLRPDEDIVDWLELPENLKVKIYNSMANYPAVSLWKYGLAEKKPFEIVEKSLGLAMWVAIARTVKIDGEASIENVLANLHKFSLKTDLSFRDRWTIRQFLAETVTAKKMLELTIPKNAFDSVVEPDGKEFLVFNSVANLWIKNKFVLEPVLNENVDVAVNNITGQAGLGVAISRQLESAGLRVIEVKADPGDNIAGTGCLFMVRGSYPISEKFLIDQLGCIKKTGAFGESNNLGIKLWLE